MRIRHLLIAGMLVAALLVASGSVVSAQVDSTAPTVQHEPLSQAYSNTNLRIVVRAVDNVGVQSATLLVRTRGTSNYFSVPMRPSRGEYVGVIPASYVQPGVLEYYIAVTDAAGNVGTYPGVNAGSRPVALKVIPDSTRPELNLAYPTGMVDKGTFVAVVNIADLADNVDPASIHVFFDGKDVTADATISRTAVSYVVPDGAMQTRTVLVVEATDLAGNTERRSFRLTQRPDVSRALNVDATSENGAAEFSAEFQMKATWGPWKGSALVKSEAFTSAQEQTPNRFNLTYDSKMLQAEVIDFQADITPLSMSDQHVRGAEGRLQFGPFMAKGVWGQSLQPIAGVDWGRRVWSVQTGIQARPFKFRLHGLGLYDQWTLAKEAVITKSPEQNYVLGADTGLNLFGKRLMLNGELGVSMYFDSAYGNLWTDFDTRKNDPSNPQDLQQILDLLDKIPNGLRSAMPLPDLFDLRVGLPKLDVAAKIDTGVRLPYANLEATAYRYGPQWRALAADADSNAIGYKLGVKSDRVANLVAVEVNRETRYENLRSLLGIILDGGSSNLSFSELMTTAPSTQTLQKLQSQDIKVDFALKNRIGVVFSTGSEDQRDAGQANADRATKDYGLQVRNVPFAVRDFAGRLGASYDITSLDDFANPALSKDTSTSTVNTTLDRDAWSYNASFTHKGETDNTGDQVSTPTVKVGATWTGRRLGRLTLPEVRWQTTYTLTSSKAVSGTTDASQQVIDVDLQLKLSDIQKLVFKGEYGVFVDQLNSANNDTNFKITAGYRMKW